MTATSVLDFVDALDDGGRAATLRSRARFGRLARQAAGGVAVTVRDESGQLCLIAGLWPDEVVQEVEAWFAVGPALRRHLRGAVRLARGALEPFAEAAAPVLVRAYLSPHSVAGPRLAAMFGFVAAEMRPSLIGPLVTWTRSFEA